MVEKGNRGWLLDKQQFTPWGKGNRMEDRGDPAGRSDYRLTLLVGAAALLGLALARSYSYLLFHCLAEIFSIIVACTVFAVFWNARRFLDNACYLFIGIAFLFVASIDLVHMLAYGDMNIFSGFGQDLAIQLWILARGVQCLSLLAAFRLPAMAICARLRFRIVRRPDHFFLYDNLLLASVSYLFHSRHRAHHVQDRQRVRHLCHSADQPRAACPAAVGIRQARVSPPGRVDRRNDLFGARLHGSTDRLPVRRTSSATI